MTTHSHSGLYFLLAILFGVAVLTFFIFQPFLYALILAIVFATVFKPVHIKAFALTKGQGSLAALLSTFFVLVVVILPITLLGTQIFQESSQLYTTLATGDGITTLSQSVNQTLNHLTQFSPVPIPVFLEIDQYLTQGLNVLLKHLGPLFASFAKILLSIFVFLVALYYLFKDGHKLKAAVVAISPLQDMYDETIFNKLTIAINSVVKGSLGVALVQGVVSAVGLSIFGVPNPVLWGSAAAVAALVPSVGTSLVLIPAILFLYVSGAVVSALGLLAWGMLAVGLVDNVLGPKLVERGVQLHPFLILLSILGGISFFGPIGFLLGPIVLSLLSALLGIYAVIGKKID